MAKSKIKPYDFSRNQPDWAAALREQYANEQNRDRAVTEKVAAIANDYIAQGDPLDDTEVQDLHAAMASGVNDWVRPRDRAPDFSNVADASSTVPILPKGFIERGNDKIASDLEELGTIGKGILGSLESKGAGAGALAADFGDTIFPYLSDAQKPFNEAVLPHLPQSVQDLAADPGQRVADFLTKESTTNMEAFKTIFKDVSDRIPAAKTANPKDFVDTSFLEELDKSGYIDGLYR